MLLEGMHLPLTTPFYPDGRLNLKKLEHNVELYSRTPAAGLLLLGLSGEPSLLSDDETRQALQTAIGAAADEKVMLAAISRDSVIETLALAEFAANLRYDAIAVAVPTILAPRAASGPLKEALLYFRMVADRSPLPVVLVSESHRPIPPEAAGELSGHPGIAGLIEMDSVPADVHATMARTKSARRDVTVTTVFSAVTERMLRAARLETTMLPAAALTAGGTAVAASSGVGKTLRTRTRQVGFQILAGSTPGMLDALQAGAVGVVPPFGACAPQACYEVYAAWKDGDGALATEKQDRLRRTASRIEKELGIGALKFGCDLNGYFGGRPRLPLLPLSGEQRAEMETLMNGLRS